MTTPDPDFVAFLREYPQYPTTKMIDDLRAVEYSRLDIGGNIYLDYTGGGLYAESQLRAHIVACLPGTCLATRIRAIQLHKPRPNLWSMPVNMS